MRIWKFRSDVENYDILIPIKETNIDKFTLDGTSVKEHWTSIPMQSYQFEMKIGDFPSVSATSTILLSERAVDLVYDLICDNVELLPVRSRKGTFYVVNVLKILDCLDYEKSSYKTFSDKKRIMYITSYSFYESKIGDNNIFKIVDAKRSNAFVSETFWSRVVNSDLEGYKFDLVWDSEEVLNK